MYLLDTNHCSAAILGDANLLRRIAEVENSLITTCVIVQGELVDMAERSQRRETNLAVINRFLQGIYIYNIDEYTATIYGQLKAALFNQFATKRFKLGNFFHRLQAALKDLLSAHSGRIDGVQEKVDKYLENIPPEARPKEILSITIVRKQRGRVRGPIKDTFLPVAMRLKVDTGKCELCRAYEKANRLEISPWKDFSHAIAFIIVFE